MRRFDPAIGCFRMWAASARLRGSLDIGIKMAVPLTDQRTMSQIVGQMAQILPQLTICGGRRLACGSPAGPAHAPTARAATLRIVSPCYRPAPYLALVRAFW
jgi:hypothetical protein